MKYRKRIQNFSSDAVFVNSMDNHIFFFFSRINGNDTCTEILLEAFGDKIVNLSDGKGR